MTFQQLSRFYARHSQGKYILDVGELRLVFLGGATATQHARAFVRDRIASVSAGEIDFHLESGRVVLVHVFPLAAFESGQPVDLHALLEHHGLIAPLYATDYGRRFNLDGFTTLANTAGEANTYAYLQVFRNGAIEGGTTGMFYDAQPGRVAPTMLASRTFAETAVGFIGRAFKLLGILEVDGPVLVAVSLLGVRGVVLDADHYSLRSTLRPFSRDVIILPDVVVEDRSMSVTTAARPLLNALWQAAGFERSSAYEPDGTWRFD